MRPFLPRRPRPHKDFRLPDCRPYATFHLSFPQAQLALPSANLDCLMADAFQETSNSNTEIDSASCKIAFQMQYYT